MVRSAAAFACLSVMVSAACAARVVNVGHVGEGLGEAHVSQVVAGGKSLSTVDSGGNSVKLKSKQRDKGGNVHVRMTQYYRGLEVFGAEIISHSIRRRSPVYASTKIVGKNRRPERKTFTTGRAVKGIQQDVGFASVASLSNEASLKTSQKLAKELERKKQATATVDAAAPSRSRRASPPKRTGEATVQERSAKAVIWLNEKNVAKVAHVVELSVEDAAGEPGLPTYVLDASSGQVLAQWDALPHRATPVVGGPGGNEAGNKHHYGADLPLLNATVSDAGPGDLCTFESDKVRVVHMRNTLDYDRSEPFRFYCGDSKNQTCDAANGAHSPLNDVNYFGHRVVDLFEQWYGEPPVPLPLVLKAHAGQLYQNAFWRDDAAYFGDGGDALYPMVTQDIVAHEVAHGFTEQTGHAQLVYYGQSGAISESFCDMAAKAVEYGAVGQGNVDWRFGAEQRKDGTPLRCLDAPSCDGASIEHVNDWRYYTDVHHGSGVFNKVFHELASRWKYGVWDAFDVMFYANKYYWTKSADFYDAAEGVLNSAQLLASDLYPTSDIVQVFALVGIACDDSAGYWACSKA